MSFIVNNGKIVLSRTVSVKPYLSHFYHGQQEKQRGERNEKDKKEKAIHFSLLRNWGFTYFSPHFVLLVVRIYSGMGKVDERPDEIGGLPDDI